MKRIYLSHPFGGREENREKAAAIARMYRAMWDAEGKTDWEIVNPLEELRDLPDGDNTLFAAVALMKTCDGVLWSPGWKKSRGCRYEHFVARHTEGRIKHFQAEIPPEVEEAAVYWYGRHHAVVKRAAA